jgi:tetratricopeptide (TPR) repeat protein
MKRMRELGAAADRAPERPGERDSGSAPAPELEPLRPDDPRCRLALAQAERVLCHRATQAPTSTCAAALPASWSQDAHQLNQRIDGLVRWIEMVTARAGRSVAQAHDSQPSADVALTLVDLAAAVLPHDLEIACSLARAAMLAAAELAAAEHDCRFLCTRLATFWKEVAAEEVYSDQLDDATVCLAAAGPLAEAGGDHPALLAGLGLNRAQIHWGRRELRRSLSELEAALVYAEQAGDPDLIGQCWYLQGIVLEQLGRLTASRQAYERCLEHLPGTDHKWLCDLARENLLKLAQDD